MYFSVTPPIFLESTIQHNYFSSHNTEATTHHQMFYGTDQIPRGPHSCPGHTYKRAEPTLEVKQGATMSSITGRRLYRGQSAHSDELWGTSRHAPY